MAAHEASEGGCTVQAPPGCLTPHTALLKFSKPAAREAHASSVSLYVAGLSSAAQETQECWRLTCVSPQICSSPNPQASLE